MSEGREFPSSPNPNIGSGSGSDSDNEMQISSAPQEGEETEETGTRSCSPSPTRSSSPSPRQPQQQPPRVQQQEGEEKEEVSPLSALSAPFSGSDDVEMKDANMVASVASVAPDCSDEQKQEEQQEDEEEQPPPPRLIITKMVLHNFKSYAGRKEVGPFHKRFSSIVGPNGSGKSNVIDALLFVFGKKAKKIRLKNISELVHTSENHPNLDKARVEIHFCEIVDEKDDDHSYSQIEGTQFVISREVTKRSASKYSLNGKHCKFAKVEEKLQSKGIDLKNNRFLILQGEVELISLMKPKAPTEHEDGLLEYLEDIIGSNAFVDEINESSILMEQLNESRQEMLNLVKVIGKARDALEDEKNEAVRYMKQEREKVFLDSKLDQFYAHRAKKLIAKVSEKKSKLEEKRDHEKEKKNCKTEEAKSMRASYSEKQSEYAEIEESIKKSREQFEVYARQDTKISQDEKHLITKDKKLKGQTAKEKRDLKKCEEAIERAENEIPNLQTQQEALVEQKKNEEKLFAEEYELAKDRLAPFILNLEKKQTKLLPLKNAENECQQAVDVTKGEIQLLEQNAEDAKKLYETAQSNYKDLGDAEVQKRNQLKEAETKANEAEKKILDGRDEFKNLAVEEKDISGSLPRLQRQAEEARAAVHSQRQQRGGGLAELMKQKRSGAIKGIYGRLGDLGSIDDMYDVAVSTAGGGTLNYIVVDTADTATKCVRYLRANNLGTYSFLILEKQEHLRNKFKLRHGTPQNVPRLFDLVRPKHEMFRTAFFYALRNTVFAENIDKGVRVHNSPGSSSGKWRVATATGELLESAGTMTGGGKSVRRGLMSSKPQSDCDITPQQLRELEQQLAHQEERVFQLQNRRRELQRERNELQNVMRRLKTDCDKLTFELREIGSKKRGLKNRLVELKKGLKVSDEDRNRLHSLQKTLEQNERALNRAQKNSESLENECAALKQEIEIQGGEKLKKLKSNVTKIGRKLDGVMSRITKLGVDAEGARKNIKKHERKLESLKEAQIENIKEIGNLKEQKKKIDQEAAETYNNVAELEIVRDKKAKLLKELEKKFKKIDDELILISKVLVDIEDGMKNYSKQINDNKRKVDTFKDKLKTHLEKLHQADKALAELEELDHLGEEGDDDDDDEKGGPSSGDENDSKQQQQQPPRDEEPFDSDGSDEDMEDVEEKHDRERKLSRKGRRVRDLAEYLFSDEELEDINPDEIQQMILSIEAVLNQSNPHLGAIEQYRGKAIQYHRKVQKLDEVTKERDQTRERHDRLKQKRLQMFMESFSVISIKLKEMYRMLTQGGDAELELVDTLNPFSEGIVFSVRPPKKSWKNISNLSGGEKTLSSLALVFALHHFKPTPLYVMDEIDAALDFKNVSIVANYIKDRTKNAQFVIISLRNNMFELANRLVGIYKTDNTSKSITVNPHNFCLQSTNPRNVPKSHNSVPQQQSQPSSSSSSSSSSQPPSQKRRRLLQTTPNTKTTTTRALSAGPEVLTENSNPNDYGRRSRSRKRPAPTSVSDAEREADEAEDNTYY